MLYALLGVIIAIATWMLKSNKQKKELEEYRAKINCKKIELKEIVFDLDKLKIEHNLKIAEINKLKSDIELYENDLGILEVGLYKPIFDYEDEEQFKEELKIIRDDQKYDVRNDNVIRCEKDWKIAGSEAKGRSLVKQYGKIMLKAHNSDCDALIAKVKHGDVSKFIERIRKSRESINKFGKMYSVSIEKSYTDLKIKELQCVHEHERLKEKKKEEAKAIKEQMRQEQAEIKALEADRKKAEKEEADALKELQVASKLLEKDVLNDKLKEKIEKLKLELKGKSENTRKIAQAQLTKSGFVYIISNPSFNVENRYKIGVTRRLNPQVRVDELSNASVPFRFDVHAMVYSDNAMELENSLHKAFDEYRVNKNNSRKEFFDVDLSLIEKELKNMGYEFEMFKNPINLDYIESK